jgi:hypothetical protein
VTFLASPNAAWLIAIICAAGGAMWIWAESRRINRRQRPLRVLAAILAGSALAALGLRPAAILNEPTVSPVAEAAALWTSSITSQPDEPIPHDVAPARIFALPGTTEKPPAAQVVPDAAFIVREYPNVRTLHVFGDGVNAFDAEVLQRLRVIFHRRSEKFANPVVSFVRAPAEVSLGDPIILQGQVQGIVPATSPVVLLIAPDGKGRRVALTPTPEGSATFSVSAPAAVATGHFVWRLELRSGEPGEVLASEEIGVSVIKPALPRILVLESSPRFDTGRLKRWLGERGAALTTRTQLGRDRFRIATLHGSRDSVEAIDSGALAAFDLVLADARAVAELGEAEREALRTAISEEGLGLLIVTDDAVFDAAASINGDASPTEFFFPWKIIRDRTDAESEERVSRLHWNGSELGRTESLPVPNVEFQRGSRLRPLVQDSQNRALVAVVSRGRGKVAHSLVTQTWRWTQLKDSTAFAAYWSYLISELARPDAAHTGNWSIKSEDSGPRFVNEPIVLQWSGPTDRAPIPAQISMDGGGRAVRMSLAQDPVNTWHWQGKYWPRRAGWHQVAAPDSGATLDFYVSEANAWQPLQAMRRQAATSRMAASYEPGKSPPAPISSATPIEFGRWWFFAILFTSLTYLWSEARTLRRSEVA